MSDDDHNVERVKWYTLARKFPQLIGRTQDGARIPGGPYTVTQAVGGFLVLLLGYNTMGLWAGSSTLSNWVILLVATGGTVFGLGRIPLGARNPIAIAAGAAKASTAPQMGRVRGRTVRIRSPHQVRHPLRVRVQLGNEGAPVGDAAVAAPSSSVDEAFGASEAVAWEPTPTSGPPISAPVVAHELPDETAAEPVDEPAAAEPVDEPAAAEPVDEPAAAEWVDEPAPPPAPPRVARPNRATHQPPAAASAGPPRRRVVRHPAAPAQLTGVQALLATVGTQPEDS